jgi:hypothetical protein
MILRRTVAVLAGGVALASFVLPGAALASPPTSTLQTHAHFDAGSAGAKAAYAWLQERRAEDASLVRAETLAPLATSAVDVDLVTTGSGRAPSDAVANGGTTLPTTGTPGQAVSISSCVAHAARTALKYAWQCEAAANCRWTLEKLETEQSASVACNGG